MRARQRRWHEVHRPAVDAVREQLRADGALTTKDLGGAKASAEWWDWSEAKIAVEWLLDVGEVVCVERRGWRRVYDLAERAIPAGPAARGAERRGVPRAPRGAGRPRAGGRTRSDLADYHRLLLDQVDGVIEATGLVPVEVEGWDAPAWADPAALETPVRGRHRTTLLSPFDSLIWDRKRTTRIFGFEHRIEAYVPKPKRVHGYYAMPLLAGGRIVGRVDPKREGTDPARGPGLGRAEARSRRWRPRCARRPSGSGATASRSAGSLRRRRRRRSARRSTGRPRRGHPATARRPYTGAEYLASLRDGREVWIDGERVADVTTHPAFRNSARSVARLYDAMHDAETSDLLDARTATGSTPTASSCRRTRSTTCSRRARRSRTGRGCRTATWAAPRTTRPRSWRRSAPTRSGTSRSPTAAATGTASTPKALFLNHVLINPPIDRDKAVHEVEDVYVHVVARARRRDRRVGAKMLATGSAITHATFVAQNSAVHLEEGKAEDYALVFIAPMDTPGKKLVCRRSYEADAPVAVGEPAVEPLRRERRGRGLRRRVHPVGERARLPRRREGDGLLRRRRGSCRATRCSRGRGWR